MDSLPQNVIQPLELLIYVSLVLLLIIGVFLIKLLLDTSNLVNSLQSFIKVTQAELEPAIKEINGTLANINNISSNLSNQINNINNNLDKGGRILSDSSERAYKRLKIFGSSVKEGVLSVIDVLFRKQ